MIDLQFSGEKGGYWLEATDDDLPHFRVKIGPCWNKDTLREMAGKLFRQETARRQAEMRNYPYAG